ncbi:MAG TPA: ABC transporter permease [Blastocatellia bacterium]|nr:ABC transporter permease [Blastocatellia bacterium]
MQTLWQDLRYGARMLLKKPGFAAMAATSLALGIGINSIIFSLIDALLLRPLPVVNPGELVALATSDHHGSRPHGLSYPDFVDFRDRHETFAGVAAYTLVPLSVTSGDQSERAWGLMVSGSYFSMLGVRPFIGRTIRDDEDQPPGRHAVVVLSYRAWQRRFGGDREAVGKTMNLNGHAFTVVGVAPPEFRGLNSNIVPELWMPLGMQAQLLPGNPGLLEARDAHSLLVWARLKPGVSFEQAQADADLQAQQLERAYPATNRNVKVRLYSQWEARFEPGLGRVMALAAGMLMGVVGLVLLVACANVANLLLARMAARHREMAIRLAIGASRFRLVRQLLTESLMLALLGGGVAALLALWMTDLISAGSSSSDNPFMLDVRMDGRVLAFNLLVALLTVVFFGLAPALKAAQTNLTTALKTEEMRLGGFGSRFAFRNLLIVIQVAISLILLICAGLFIRGLANAQKVDLGLRTKNVQLASLDLGLNGYDANQGRAFYRELIGRARAIPSVRSASMVNYAPFDFSASSDTVVIEGRDPAREDGKIALLSSVVGIDYFATIGTPIVRGRDFAPQDDESHPAVAIINETMARRFWSPEDAVGKHLRLGRPEGPRVEVIGIARDGKYRQYFEDPQPCLFLPWTQHYRDRMTLVLHTEVESPAIVATLGHEVAALDPNLPLFDLKTMEAHIEERLMVWPLLASSSLSVCGLAGLLLAIVGFYGVVAYSVAARTREIGIRMALGARASDVRGLIIRQGMKLVFIGVALGLIVSFGLTRLLQSLLFGVSATDPLTFIVITSALALVALLACWIPARRAAKVDPMVALRFE